MARDAHLGRIWATAGDWPTYMANKQHSGINGTETLINSTTAANLKVRWTAKGGGMIFSQPVVANRMVYWGSWDGYEHATNLNGGSVWQQNLGQTTSNCGTKTTFGVISTATVASVSIDGTMTPVVFVGGGDDHLYALYASTGAIIWRIPLGRHLLQTPSSGIHLSCTKEACISALHLLEIVHSYRDSSCA